MTYQSGAGRSSLQPAGFFPGFKICQKYCTRLELVLVREETGAHRGKQWYAAISLFLGLNKPDIYISIFISFGDQTIESF